MKQLLRGRKFKSYRGMGSIEAMQQGSKDRYFQEDEGDIKKLVPEGISARVPLKALKRSNASIDWWIKSWHGLLWS